MYVYHSNILIGGDAWIITEIQIWIINLNNWTIDFYKFSMIIEYS